MALELRVGEPELVALAVDPQQPRRELLQQPQGHRLILNEDPVAALAGDLAPDHQLVTLGLARSLDPRRAQELAQGLVAVEDPGHCRALGAFADQIARGARAGEERQRVDHQRLPRAGLAGEHIQAGPELDLAPRQYRQISHAESAQHFRSEI